MKGVQPSTLQKHSQVGHPAAPGWGVPRGLKQPCPALALEESWSGAQGGSHGEGEVAEGMKRSLGVGAGALGGCMGAC